MGHYIVGDSSLLQSLSGVTTLNDKASFVGTNSSLTMTATGGAVVTSGNYKIHTFTTSGTFSVTNALNTVIEYVIVAGGGFGGRTNGATNVKSASGGGGAGGYLEYVIGVSTPGSDYQGNKAIVNTGDNITVVVGAGAPANSSATGGPPGSNSYISGPNVASIVYGGGFGATYSVDAGDGANGGGSGWVNGGTLTARAAGATTYLLPIMGTNGTTVAAGGAGGNGGGAARTSPLDGVVYATGGFGTNTNGAGTNAAANTGNGGGGARSASTGSYNGGAGGSGIVLIRYRYQ